MNTKVIAAIVIVVLLLGGGFFLMSKSKPASQQQTAIAQPTAAQQNTIFSSIKDALSRSLSLQCSFTDASGRQITSYIKNGAVRADIVATDPKQSGSVIVGKDGKVYYWNGKQGFMMVMPTGTQANPSVTANAQGAAMMAAMEKYKDSCKPGVVADSLFTPPADVSFQDMSKMMQPQTNGATGGSGGYAVPSAYQQQMQQYQQKATNQGY